MDERLIDARNQYQQGDELMSNVNKKSIRRIHLTTDVGLQNVYGENFHINTKKKITVHGGSGDAYNEGYTRNPWRGEHVTVPLIPEYSGGAPLGGELNREYAIEISFHKGDVMVELVTWLPSDEDRV